MNESNTKNYEVGKKIYMCVCVYTDTHMYIYMHIYITILYLKRGRIVDCRETQVAL